jgi:predicted dehydrogenase
MAQRKLRIALVGLGFGCEFAPIYLNHPDVEWLVVCDNDPHRLNKLADRYEIARRATDFQQIIASPDIDAVHLVTPIPLHALQALAVLRLGKHCACTVPMATSLKDLHAIVRAQRETGRNYMMMETAVYTREFLFAQELVQSGQSGAIQFLRGAHYQDMENWPPYWMGLPPMWYATHAVSPLLALARTRAKRVHCFGSGTMRTELHSQYGNPFPVESAIVELARPSLAAEVTRTLFHTARSYTESFTVYGERKTFEWQQIEDEKPVLFAMEDQPAAGGAGHTARQITSERIAVPDRADLLPTEIARFTRQGVYDASKPHLSFLQGGGHGGSHPHLVHEFVRSIVEERKPRIDAVIAADWTAVGICAHQSAMTGGEQVNVPDFRE